MRRNQRALGASTNPRHAESDAPGLPDTRIHAPVSVHPQTHPHGKASRPIQPQACGGSRSGKPRARPRRDATSGGRGERAAPRNAWWNRSAHPRARRRTRSDGPRVPDRPRRHGAAPRAPEDLGTSSHDTHTPSPHHLAGPASLSDPGPSLWLPNLTNHGCSCSSSTLQGPIYLLPRQRTSRSLRSVSQW